MTASLYFFGVACAGAGFLLGAADMVTPGVGRWLGGITLVVGLVFYTATKAPL